MGSVSGDANEALGGVIALGNCQGAGDDAGSSAQTRATRDEGGNARPNERRGCLEGDRNEGQRIASAVNQRKVAEEQLTAQKGQALFESNVKKRLDPGALENGRIPKITGVADPKRG